MRRTNRLGGVDEDCLTRDRVREKVAPPRLSCEVIRRRGGDPFVGLKLPQMLTNAGLSISGVTQLRQRRQPTVDFPYPSQLRRTGRRCAALGRTAAQRQEATKG